MKLHVLLMAFLTAMLLTESTFAQTQTSEPTGLLNACNDSLKEINVADQNKLTGDDKACSDQVDKSWKNCYVADDSGDPLKPFSNDADTASLYSNTGGATGDQNIINAYTAGKTRSLSRADNCATERRNVDNVCGQRLQAVKDQLTGVNRAYDSVAQTLNETAGTDPNRATFINQQNQLHQQSLDLQHERDQLQTVHDAGVSAMGDRYTCHANQAKLYNDGITSTAAHLNAISSVDSQPTPSTGSGAASDPNLNHAISNAETSGVGNLTKQGVAAVVGDDAITGVASTGAKAAFNGSFSGTISSAVSDGAETLTGKALTGAGIGTMVAGPVGTVVGGGVAVGADLATSSTPVGSCSTVYIDPVVAYGAGCQANTNLAISVLRSH